MHTCVCVCVFCWVAFLFSYIHTYMFPSLPKIWIIIMDSFFAFMISACVCVQEKERKNKLGQ